jgi:hypothetical protein
MSNITQDIHTQNIKHANNYNLTDIVKNQNEINNYLLGYLDDIRDNMEICIQNITTIDNRSNKNNIDILQLKKQNIELQRNIHNLEHKLQTQNQIFCKLTLDANNVINTQINEPNQHNQHNLTIIHKLIDFCKHIQ